MKLSILGRSLVVLNTLDAIFTGILVYHYGASAELNPAMLSVLGTCGTPRTILFLGYKLLLVNIAIVMAYRYNPDIRWVKVWFGVCIVIYTLAVLLELAIFARLGLGI